MAALYWEENMKRFTKRMVIAALVVFGILLASASAYLLTDKSVLGIENFSPADCSLSLTAHLFPDDGFLQEYTYLEGDYSYCYDGGILQSRATAIAWVRYAPDVYQKAKEACVQQFSLCKNHCFTVEGYSFAENLCHIQENELGKWEATCQYPSHFNMFAFNDDDCSLLFLGYYCDDESDEITLLAKSDFEAFLIKAFSNSLN